MVIFQLVNSVFSELSVVRKAFCGFINLVSCLQALVVGLGAFFAP
jgi:hypothetical protein